MQLFRTAQALEAVEQDPHASDLHPLQWLLDAPQPDAGTLAADAAAVRFAMVFDREGFSPKLFAELQAQRIAILTYHKYPEAAWPSEEFSRQSVRLVSGEVVERELAERGTRLSNGL